MPIVQEQSIGNTRIRIHDDQCRNITEAEAREVLAQVANCARTAAEPDKRTRR